MVSITHKLYSCISLLILTGCVGLGPNGVIPQDPSAVGDTALADGLNHLVANAPTNPADYTAWIIAGLGAIGAASAGAVGVYKKKKKAGATS